jgi:hypothetical protein
MGQAFQGGDKHNPRLDEELAGDPVAGEETPDATLWDAPGHEGIVSDAETDPDRTDLRPRIGAYVSLASFPADGAMRLAGWA